MRLLPLLRFHPAIAALLLATGLSIAACRGGGRATSPDPGRESASAPTISAVRLISGVPMAGETVQLNATATNLVTRWNWDFGTGATPPTSQEAEPNVQLLAVGRHSGQVWATNGFGTSNPFVFPYSIAPAIAPKLGPVAPDGRWMSTGKITRFTLPVDPAGGLPSHYEWNIAGGELVGPTNNSVVAFRPSRTGTHFGNVRAINQFGEAERVMSFTALKAPKLGGVELLDTSDLSRGVYAVIPQYSVFGQAHRFAYHWQLNEPYPGDSLGDSASNWDPPALMVYPENASHIAGSFQICEWDWNCSDPMSFDFDVEPTGGSPSWTQSPIATVQADWTALGIVELIAGTPCVVYHAYEQDKTSSLHFARATTMEPRSSSDWVTHELVHPSDNMPALSRLKLMDRRGHPLISILDMKRKERLFDATSADPRTANDWRRATIGDEVLPDGNSFSGNPLDIEVSPLGEIYFTGFDDDDTIKVIRLPPSADVTSDIWESHAIPAPPGSYDLHLAFFDSRPVIIGNMSMQNKSCHFVLASTTPKPASAAEWVSYDLSSLFLGAISYYVGDLTSGDGHLSLAFAGYENSPVDEGEWLMQTADPDAGASQWQVLSVPRLETDPMLFYPTYDLTEYRNRWIQLDAAGGTNPGAIVVSHMDVATPQTVKDWSVHVVSRGTTLSWYRSTAASADHLYILGINDFSTPVLFWTTDDF